MSFTSLLLLSFVREFTQGTRIHLHIIKEELLIFFFNQKPCFLSCDTINALRKYHKFFEEKGLHKICGENVIVPVKEIVVECLQLNEVDVLVYETVINALTGA